MIHILKKIAIESFRLTEARKNGKLHYVGGTKFGKVIINALALIIEIRGNQFDQL